MKVVQYLTIAMLFVNRNYSYTNKRLISFKKLELLMKKDSSENKLSILYKPKTYNQAQYVNALNKKEDSITVVVGPAGTGKTLMACNSAVNYLKESKIDKIIITRPVVPVEEDIGFLPGSMVKKMDPWTRPIFDIFEEYYSKAQVNNMVLNGQIEISPLGYMRGRTFKNAFIIADEMQNSSPNQMYMLLTRIGENSRMVITGDLEQSDKLENNGLKDLIQKLKSTTDTKNIMLVELNKTDIQRSELVNQVVALYSKPITNKIEFIKEITREKIIKFNDDAALIPLKDMNRLDQYKK
jgi:phosphate starvation-inducible PhoH-like protein